MIVSHLDLKGLRELRARAVVPSLEAGGSTVDRDARHDVARRIENMDAPAAPVRLQILRLDLAYGRNRSRTGFRVAGELKTVWVHL
jgi:hypothetical protein